MTIMETQFDADTARKVDLINKKIDEINQRRMGCRTTRIEDELDREELEGYINSLKLTEDQKKLIAKCNKNNEKFVVEKNAVYFIIMFISVILQFYLAYIIYDLLVQPSLDTYELVYLVMLGAIFAFNLIQILRYLRIWK